MRPRIYRKTITITPKSGGVVTSHHLSLEAGALLKVLSPVPCRLAFRSTDPNMVRIVGELTSWGREHNHGDIKVACPELGAYISMQEAYYETMVQDGVFPYLMEQHGASLWAELQERGTLLHSMGHLHVRLMLELDTREVIEPFTVEVTLLNVEWQAGYGGEWMNRLVGI